MEKILDELIGVKSVGLSGHIRPDGDCVGSCMAMYHYLKNAMPENTVIDVILETVPSSFDCIGDIDLIREYPRRQGYDAFIVLDCNKERTGNALPGIEKSKKVINIDHHVSNPGTGNINHVEPEAAATCQVIYGLMDKQYIDKEVALDLYIGIINDTGVMQYSNTSPKTLRILAELVEYGFDFPTIIRKSFYEKSFVQQKLLGHCLDKSQLFLEGKCIISYLTRQEMKDFGVTGKDMEGIVSQLGNTEGVEVAVHMYEFEEGQWKISFRSKKIVDVSTIASGFGGGGHIRAAGCVINGDAESVIGRYLPLIEAGLQEHEVQSGQ